MSDDLASLAAETRSEKQDSTLLMGVMENTTGRRAVRTAVNGPIMAEVLAMPKVGDGFEVNGIRLEVAADGMFTLSFTEPGVTHVAATGSINHRQIELTAGNGSHG